MWKATESTGAKTYTASTKRELLDTLANEEGWEYRQHGGSAKSEKVEAGTYRISDGWTTYYASRA